MKKRKVEWGDQVYLQPSYIRRSYPTEIAKKYAEGIEDYDYISDTQKNRCVVTDTMPRDLFYVKIKMGYDGAAYKVPASTLYYANVEQVMGTKDPFVDLNLEEKLEKGYQNIMEKRDIKFGDRIFLQPSWIRKNLEQKYAEKYADGIKDDEYIKDTQKNRCFVTDMMLNNLWNVEVQMKIDGERYSVPVSELYFVNDKQKEYRNMLYGRLINTPKMYPSLKVDHIIYNDPATIVFWKDGTKTVVKRAKGEKFNKYYAFCAALAKKAFGNNSQVNKIVASGVDQTAKKKTAAKKKAKFVRDEKGRYISATLVKKK